MLGPSHGTRRLLDAAVAGADLHYSIVGETNVPQVAQALAAAGRGVAVVSDDRRYGLHGLLITTTAGALRIPLVAAWDPDPLRGDRHRDAGRRRWPSTRPCATPAGRDARHGKHAETTAQARRR